MHKRPLGWPLVERWFDGQGLAFCCFGKASWVKKIAREQRTSSEQSSPGGHAATRSSRHNSLQLFTVMMMRTMTNPVQPLAVCSLLLLSLPSISAELDDMKIMSKMGWPAAAASAAAAAIGNHTDPDNDQSHHANEMAANILGYTLVGIMVLMFFFAVVTFGRSCCIQCKNVSLGFCYSCVACSRISPPHINPSRHSSSSIRPHSYPIYTVLHCILTTRLQGMLPIYARKTARRWRRRGWHFKRSNFRSGTGGARGRGRSRIGSRTADGCIATCRQIATT